MPSLSLFRSLCTVGVALAVVLGAAGCDHITEPEGPRLVDRFGPFTPLDPITADRAAVDFAADEQVVFSGSFNKQVNWVVEITGQESGAVKRIEGFSSELGETNAVWQGGTTELPFFKNESVEAALFVPSENSDTSRVSLEVTAPRTYPGNVFAAFEGGTDVTLGNFEFELDVTATGISSEVPAGEGGSFYLLRGSERPAGDGTRNFFVGLADIRPDGGGLFGVPTTVPDNLHFNFLLRGFGSEFTIAVIQLIADGNGTGAYEVDQDTVFPFGDIVVDFEGWQLFSKPVSELGLSQQQAGEIVAVRLVLISDNNAQPDVALPVDFGIDYITFTGGGPLEL